MNNSIGFIGAGNMGEAIIGAVIGAKLSPPSAIYASDVNQERLNTINTNYGIHVTKDNHTVFNTCDTIVLAVKPQQMDDILSDIIRHVELSNTGKKLIISIAAGIRIEKIESHLYAAVSKERRADFPIIRVMPNTPALVLKGVSGMSANRFATDEDIAAARSILSAMGSVVELKEDDLDAVTAVSGSGPAYVFYLAESMIDAGIGLGLSPEKARALTLGTIAGAVSLLEKSGEPPEQLRQKVTSPGGTTEAAVHVLDAHHVKTTVVNAITAAAERSRALSK